MAVKIRMTRTGARNSPCFRVVATDGRAPRDGRFIEILGWYDPKLEGPNVCVDTDRIAHWKSEGAQVSDSVASLLRRAEKVGMAEATHGPSADEGAADAAAPEAAEAADTSDEQAAPEATETEATADEATGAQGAEEAADAPTEPEQEPADKPA